MPDVVARLHIPRADHTFDYVELPPWIASRLRSADVGHEQLVGLVVWLAAGAIMTVGGYLFAGAWFAIATVCAVVSTPLVLLSRWSGRRVARLVESLPFFVEAIARSLRSGASFSQALYEGGVESPSVVAAEVQILVNEIETGRSITAALRGWSARAEESEVRIVAAALAFAAENESGAGISLIGVGQTLRDRAALRGEVRSLTAQASASMQALVLLPVAFLAIDVLSGQDVLRFLTSTTYGRLCVITGIGLDLIGWFWMRSIVRRCLP